MQNKKISTRKIVVYFIPLISLFLFTPVINAQPTFDRNTLNEDALTMKDLQVKSKVMWEYYYNDDESLRDSGYKSYMCSFDAEGRVTEYTTYHIFSDLTVKELYTYNKEGNITKIARYNSAGDMVETIMYAYNLWGKFRKEQYTAYYNSIRPGVYFTILANVDNDTVFSRLQNDLEIEPKLQSYTITVNISDPDEEDQYIVIGDESDPSSLRFSWSQLSQSTKQGLLSWKGPTRKEHTYVNKNIDHIDFSYDNRRNLIGRVVYNTANDVIEKESYRYDANNNRIGYYKYDENGKLSSFETYTYDDKWNLIETLASNPDGKLSSRLEYKYDSTNKPAQETWFNPDGSVISKSEFKYDSLNNLKEEIKYHGDNEKESSLTYSYDNDGLLIEMMKYDSDGKKVKLTRYIYNK